MKMLIFICITLFYFGEAAALDRPVIDNSQIDVQAMIQQAWDECQKKELNPYKKIECGREARSKYVRQGKLRGTDEYCELHYFKLNFRDLEQVFRELRQQTNIARGSDTLMWEKALPGEVTREQLEIELFWIESRLSKMQKARSEQKRKALYQKTGHKTP